MCVCAVNYSPIFLAVNACYIPSVVGGEEKKNEECKRQTCGGYIPWHIVCGYRNGSCILLTRGAFSIYRAQRDSEEANVCSPRYFLCRFLSLTSISSREDPRATSHFVYAVYIILYNWFPSPRNFFWRYALFHSPSSICLTYTILLKPRWLQHS